MNLPTPPAPVFEVTRDNFEADVLQASLETPVLLDFWADWCGPCKALGPVLEKLAADYGGAFRLGKIDVDHEQELAQVFAIRSIPTVMLVAGGKPVDGFSGALPEGKVREFLGRHLTPPLAGDAAADHAGAPAAEAPVESPEHRVTRLRRELDADPDNTALRQDLIHALLRAGQTSDAESELSALPDKTSDEARTRALRQHLELLRTLEAAPDRVTLQQRVAADASDWEARDLLGIHLLLDTEPGSGLEQWLYILEHAPQWNDGQARKRLLAAFDALDDAQLVGTYRRRMASLLF